MVLRACLIRHAHTGENRYRSEGIASDWRSRGPLGCRWRASAGIRVLDRNKRLISKGKHERLALANLHRGKRSASAGIRVLDRNKRLISKGKHERLALANLHRGEDKCERRDSNPGSGVGNAR